MYNYENFSPNALVVTQRMRERARELNSAFVGAVHILFGILAVTEGRGHKVLFEMGVGIHDLELSARSRLMELEPGSHMSTIVLQRQAEKVIDRAWEEAELLNSRILGTEHLLLGLLRLGDGLITSIEFRKAGVTLEGAKQALLELLARENAAS